MVEAAQVVLWHGAGGAADELFIMLGLGSIFFGITRYTDKSRARGRRLAGASLVLLGIGAMLAPFVFGFGAVNQAKVRIPSPATIRILSPTTGAEEKGDFMDVRIELSGASLVKKTSTKLKPTEGHLQLSIDGRPYNRDLGKSLRLNIADLSPGRHLLQVEFVATDYGPFKPPVRADTIFKVRE